MVNTRTRKEMESSIVGDDTKITKLSVHKNTLTIDICPSNDFIRNELYMQ